MILIRKRTPVFRPGFAHRDLNHILITGQSLSIGALGTPALTTTQPSNHLMYAQGILALSSWFSVTPLIEGTYPGDETGWAAAANMIGTFAEEMGHGHRLLMSAHGGGGAAYSLLKRGSANYNIGMSQAQSMLTIAIALGDLSNRIPAVFKVHGEDDQKNGSTTYYTDMFEWWTDYNSDIRAITGQRERVIAFHSQTNAWTKYGATATPSATPMDQVRACADSGGKMVMVGPKYQLPYADGLHLTNAGYQRLGEYYAKAYRRAVLEGLPWEPVRPRRIIRDGANIDLVFHVPVRPLRFDTERVSNPGNMGFEYTDNSSPPAISSVSITSPTTVRVTLASTPTGGAKRIRYAFTGTPSFNAGPVFGPRGCLRDSDKTASLHGHDLHNWCVAFNEAVP